MADKDTRRRRVGEAGVVLGFLALAGLVFQQTRTSFVEQGAASGGAMYNAALFPELLGWSLLLLAAIQVFRLLRPGGQPAADPPQLAGVAAPEDTGDRRSLRQALVCLALFVVYLLLLRPVGYHLATPVFMAACYYVLGTRNIVVALLLAIATSLAMSFVFEYWMNVILPVGRFGIGF